MMTLRDCRPFLAALAILTLRCALPGEARTQGIDFIREHYLKYEYRIPMRDGVRLFTSVYIPKSVSEVSKDPAVRRRKAPILLMRTPYGVAPYGVEAYKSEIGPSPKFGREGYIVAYQDVRGRWMSEGDFENMRPHRDHKRGPKEIDESTDTYDTIDWLVKNVPGNNERVGMWGISYPGFYAAAGMIDAHPALKAVSPQAPVTDWFAGDDWHHNGAFFLPHAFGFLGSFGRARPEPTHQPSPGFHVTKPDGYAFYLSLGPLANVDRLYFKGQVAFWDEMMHHGTYDEFWQARDIRRHLNGIKPAVLTVGGWYDAENLFGALETYKKVEASSPGTENRLVMGPWRHGGWARDDGSKLGPVAFHSRTSEFFREAIEFPFFEHHLNEKECQDTTEAWIFETGTNRWRSFDAWPPRGARSRSLYVLPGARLGFEPPATNAEQGDEVRFDEYISDPSHPVEYTDQLEEGMANDYMVRDQRFASRRPDVVSYLSDELKEDLTVVGPVGARLFVSTSGTDSDWVVKLIDVYPEDDPDGGEGSSKMGGYQQLVRGDVLRGKFRESLSKPEPFEPGRPTPVTFRLQDVAHTFRAGHRMMVQVQSSWFPLVDRNPQTFADIYQTRPSDFRKATQRIFHTAKLPTRLEILELPH